MKTWKRVLSLFMVVLMLTSVMPISVFAEEGTEPPAEGSEVQPPEHVHEYAAVVTAPGCETEGYTTYACLCGDSYVGDAVAAAGHSWSEWAEAEGVKTRSCAVCGATEQETVAPEHVHEYAAAVTAPGCETEGYTTYTCLCGDSYVGDAVAAAGHSWSEWTEAEGVRTRACAVCGATEQETVALPQLSGQMTPIYFYNEAG